MGWVTYTGFVSEIRLHSDYSCGSPVRPGAMRSVAPDETAGSRAHQRRQMARMALSSPWAIIAGLADCGLAHALAHERPEPGQMVDVVGQPLAFCQEFFFAVGDEIVASPAGTRMAAVT